MTVVAIDIFGGGESSVSADKAAGSPRGSRAAA